MKQKTLIPLIVFLLGICLVGIILYKVDSHETAQNHTTALLNATTYGERIKNEITEGIDVTDVLKQILISESGEFNQFDMIAENLISEHLPGAFIIYRADKEDDELFYANHEFLSMTGYQSMDEFFRLTNKSFHNLIREDEQQQIEASIWEQIDSGNENDYIHFHLRKADGSYLSVLDHGRIVESPQYGKVFYVLFMDWEDMHIHYSDKFSG